MALLTHQEAVGFTFDVPGRTGPRPKPVDKDELEREKQFFELLKQEQKILENNVAEAAGHRKVAEGDDFAERQAEAVKVLAALQQTIAGGMAKLMPETDPIKILESEIATFRRAAENAFRDIQASVAAGLDLRAAQANLAAYENRLDDVLSRAKADAALAAATAGLPKTIPPGGAPPMYSVSPVMPTLGAGGIGSEIR